MRRVLPVAELVRVAGAAPCPACQVIDEIRYAISQGAQTKAEKLRKSPNVRAVMVHKCERGEG